MLFRKSIFGALPNKDVFLICDNLISDGNKLSEFLDSKSSRLYLMFTVFLKIKKLQMFLIIPPSLNLLFYVTQIYKI